MPPAAPDSPAAAGLLLPGPLSLAELHAARLDGHLRALHAGFLPPDLPETPAARALALAAGLPPGSATVGGATVLSGAALWVLGALARIPSGGVRLGPAPGARGGGRRSRVAADAAEGWITHGGARIAVVRTGAPGLWALSPGEAAACARSELAERGRPGTREGEPGGAPGDPGLAALEWAELEAAVAFLDGDPAAGAHPGAASGSPARSRAG